MDSNYISAVKSKWNRQSKAEEVRRNYWQFPEICGYLNTKICGEALPGVSDGLAARLKSIGPFLRGVSVGCGRATKESKLLSTGIVRHFDLYDLSDERLVEAASLQQRLGIADQATLRCEDAFKNQTLETYDLVYWHAALHHMPDVHRALQWSYAALKPGGVLALREYTGPSRWQFSDQNVELINRFRSALPQHLRPKDIEVRRPTIESMLARDPSEAADSENILPALHATFPDAEIIPLGGGLYSFGLRGVWGRLGPEDAWMFRMILAYDEAIMGDGNVTCAFAFKPS